MEDHLANKTNAACTGGLPWCVFWCPRNRPRVEHNHHPLGGGPSPLVPYPISPTWGYWTESVEYALKKNRGIYEPVEKPTSVSPMRFCINFRKLDELSTSDAYPMLRVGALLDQIGEARVLSTIDLMKGYLQIPLAKGAQETTFVTTSEYIISSKSPSGCMELQLCFKELWTRWWKMLVIVQLPVLMIFSPTWEVRTGLRRMIEALCKATNFF